MYFRYLTFSCPGQTKFIHSTEKKNKKIRRGDCKGGGSERNVRDTEEGCLEHRVTVTLVYSH